jgi:hypothetical protein
LIRLFPGNRFNTVSQLFIHKEGFVKFKYNLYKRENAVFLSVVAGRIDFPSKSCYLLPAFPPKKLAAGVPTF